MFIQYIWPASSIVRRITKHDAGLSSVRKSKISVIQPVKKLADVDTAQRRSIYEHACFSAALLKSKIFKLLIKIKLWQLQSALCVSIYDHAQY